MPKEREIRGKFYYQSGELRLSNSFDGSFLQRGDNIYEVFRIHQSIPLFLEDHLQRFQNSLKLKGLTCGYSFSGTQEIIHQVIYKNRISKGNVKLVYHNEPGCSFLCMYPIPFFYPEEKDYISGIYTKLIQQERPDPAVKNWNQHFKEKIKKIKKESGAYELILTRPDGILTEGSQSNLFFIKNDELFTADNQLVLSGITRKYVIEIANRENIQVRTGEIHIEELNDFQSCFICGTSPAVLPVRKLDNYLYDVTHPLMRTISRQYETLTTEYIRNYKK